MGTFSPTHWFIVLVMITPLMALLMLVPVVGLLVPWVVSFLKWPSDRDYKTSTSKGGVIAGFVLLPLAVGVLALMVTTTFGIGAGGFLRGEMVAHRGAA